MKTDYTKIASVCVTVLCAALGAYIFIRYLLPCVLPFAVAWLISTAIHPLTARFGGGKKLSGKISGVAITFVVLSAIVAVTVLGVRRGVLEVKELVERVTGDPEVIARTVQTARETVESFLDRIPGVGESTGGGETVDRLINSMTAALVNALPQVLKKIVGVMPKIVFSAFVAVIASFYFSYDLEKINSSVLSVFPKRWRGKICDMKNGMLGVAGGYVRAYLTLMLIVCFALLVGFLISGVKYALLLAVLISFLDILPAFGTGTVLIPWGIISLMQGDARLGAGLLITYAATTVLRQICEAKLVGTHIGIHPLLALLGIYLGYSLFGFAGLILGPAVMLCIRWLILARQPSLSRPEDRGSNARRA